MTRQDTLGLVLVICLAGAACDRGSTTPPKGRVVGLDGRPCGSIPVRVTGCADRATAADGAFDTRCAGPTYDVAVRPFSSAGVVYQGLTRRDPVVTVPYFCPFYDSVTVSGSVAGHDPARILQLSVTSSDHPSGIISPSGDGAYSFEAFWPGEEAPATLRALESTWTPGMTGELESFTGYGEAPFSLAHGQDPVVSPALQPIANGAIALSVSNAPVGSLRLSLWATWPDGAETPLGYVLTEDGHATVATPAVPGTTFTVLAERVDDPALFAWRRGLAATATASPVAFPPGIQFTSPGEGATLDAETEFTFTSVPDAVYYVSFRADVPGGPMLHVVTRETTVKMPDFSWADLPAPSGVPVVVTLDAAGPFASVDELAGARFGSVPDWWWLAERLPAADGFATQTSLTVQAP
jgi:hypothetical protein